MEESDIIELEKRYWLLKAQSKSGRFDVDTFRPIVSPPVPQQLVEGRFAPLNYSFEYLLHNNRSSDKEFIVFKVVSVVEVSQSA